RRDDGWEGRSAGDGAGIRHRPLPRLPRRAQGRAGHHRDEEGRLSGRRPGGGDQRDPAGPVGRARRRVGTRPGNGASMSKIVVVEDSQADQQLIASYLKSASHTVVSYGSADKLEERLII